MQYDVIRSMIYAYPDKVAPVIFRPQWVASMGCDPIAGEQCGDGALAGSNQAIFLITLPPHHVELQWRLVLAHVDQKGTYR